MARLTIVLVALACTQQPQVGVTEPIPVRPTSPRSASDSIVAAVLYQVATRGLPDFRPTPTIVVQKDSDIVTSASVPSVDSMVQDDTAHAGVGQRRSR